MIVAGVCAFGAAPAALGPPGSSLPHVARLYLAFGGLVIVATAAGVALVLRELRQSPGGRAHITPQAHWYLTILLLIGSQMLWESEIRALVPALGSRPRGITDSLLDGAVLICALALAAMARSGRPMPSPRAWAVTILTVGLAARLVAYALPTVALSAAALVAVGAALVVGHAFLAGVIAARPPLSAPARGRLFTLMIAVGAALAVRGQYADLPWAVLLANAGVAAAALTWSLGLYVEFFAPLRASAGLPVAAQSDATPAPGAATGAESGVAGHRSVDERLHEVRSTVAGIRAAADLFDNESVDAEARAHLRQSMRSELERLSRLVSATATAPQAVPSQPVDLDEQLAALTDTHRARGREVDWTPSGARVLGRPDDVRVALNILLENTAAHTDGASSRIEVTEDDRSVEILVSDDGPGIAPDARDSVFVWGVSGDQRGQGIGLSMARRLLSEQGGSIDLVDHPDRGATFSIRLPGVHVPGVRLPQDDHVDHA